MSVRIGQRGGRWVELDAWHAASAGEPLRFHDSAHALRFLRERTATGDLRLLRALLADGDVHPHRLDDGTVLRVIAGRLVARTLRATLGLDPRWTFVEDIAEWVPPRIELPAPPLRLPEPLAPLVAEPPSSPAHTPESPVVVFDDWDGAAQAETLVRAAEHGVPFCEICRRPRHESRSTKAVTPAEAAANEPAQSTSPRELDPTAQAETLVRAADNGVPASPDVPGAAPAASESSETEAPAEAEVLPDELEAAAQAETLVRAARDGVPFCEICRRPQRGDG